MCLAKCQPSLENPLASATSGRTCYRECSRKCLSSCVVLKRRDGVDAEEEEELPEFPAALAPRAVEDGPAAALSPPPPATVSGLEQQAVDELSTLLAQLHKRK